MVTVFIPTYNCENVIRETLDSVLTQSYRSFEVLCVDDGSVDGTFAILEEYAAKDCRVRCFRKYNEGSVPYSWNYVFPKIKGDFTFYMSHDDLLDRDTLKLLVKELDRDEKTDLVIPSVVYFTKNMEFPEHRFDQINQKYNVGGRSSITGEVAFDQMLDYSIPGFGLWRTGLICRLGMPVTSFNSDECMQRIWARHCRVVAFSSARFGYRQVSGSIVSGLKPYHLFSIDTNLRLFREMQNCTSITKERKDEMISLFYRSLYYLNRQFKKIGGCMSSEQCNEFIRLRDDSYRAYRHLLKNDGTLKGLFYKLTSIVPLLFK